MPDSEDSPSESSQLKDLDNLLKCAICYEYLKTTLMTPCSHNFCSYCIRQSLSYRTQCPTCFEDVTEFQLRPNRVVDEFICIFTCLKGKFKCFSNVRKLNCENLKSNEESLERRITSEFNTKVSVQSTSSPSSLKSDVNEVSREDLSSNSAPSTSKEDVRIPDKFVAKREVQIASLFSPKKSKTLAVNETRVPCPVCSVEIPEKNINAHLDACLKRSEEKRVVPGEKRKLLPKLVYHLLPDKDLRKKLQELGLGTTGDRATLINRHKRYTLLYNSECDSLKPRSVAEIIKQMKKEEEEEKKSVPQVVKKLNVDRKADPQTNEEAQRQYLEENKASFQKLIEEARRNREARKNSSKTRICDDTTIEGTSSPSKTSTSKCLSQKVKLFPSNKNKENDIDEDDDDDEIEVLSDSHSENTPKKATKNENNDECKALKSNDKGSSSNTDPNSPNAFDMDGDDTDEYISQAMSKKKRRISSSPEQGSDFLSSVTSPVLGNKSKSKLNKTPGRTPKSMNSCKKNLTSEFQPLTKCISTSFSKSPAGQDAPEDADSDSSSNHSTSLMMYSGPEYEGGNEQNVPTKSSSQSTNQNISPGLEKSHFDLGIEEILQNSEDFISVPVCRQSSRIRKSKRNSPSSDANVRVLRKRVKIDDL
ncbi:hypothetical protein R5R35_009652 [Gryllus longicercus]|uniref:RING-type E3 ubiquitin transferase n=1 Tax=Gryllus longicercus TaxID=2509291 RepID=A0AAN9V7V8_9ORTH